MELVEALVDVRPIGALVPVDEVLGAVFHAEGVVARAATAMVAPLTADQLVVSVVAGNAVAPRLIMPVQKSETQQVRSEGDIVMVRASTRIG